MAWCDFCDEMTPTGTCPECSLPMCDICMRCDPCIYGDWYDEDGDRAGLEWLA